jgi:hypothetical protein
MITIKRLGAALLLLTTCAACSADVGDEGDPAEESAEGDAVATTTQASTISYGALQKNSVPCSRRGASAANCRPGTPANPYTRGCSAINRCHQ